MRVTAICAAAVVALAVPAGAAARTVPCAMVADDQRGLVETTAGEPERDLLRAAVGSDRRRVTVVLGLAALPATPSRTEHRLVDYTMRFTVGGGTAFLTAPAHEGTVGSFGVELGFRPVVLGEATVVRDGRRRELRVSAPVAAFAPWVDLRPGGTATRLAAMVTVTPGAGSSPAAARPQTLVVDGADGAATYRLGAPSCALSR